MKKDILVKRAKFIDKNKTLGQEFSFAHPDTLLQLIQMYNSDFTGSCYGIYLVENNKCWKILTIQL